MKSLITVLLLQLLFAANVLASEPIGRIVKLHGKVERAKAGEPAKALIKGDFLYVGDQIESKSKSFAKILMNDDTIFQLGPISKFNFEEFKMRTKSDRTATYNLVHGKLRSLFTVKAPRRSLTIKTPTASMGIRGTEILSDVYRYKGKIKTDIALLSGKLELTTGRKKFFLKTGYVAEFVKGQKNDIKSTTKKLSRDIFNAVRKESRRGGEVFLNDARQKLKKVKASDIEFKIKEKVQKNDDVSLNESKKIKKYSKSQMSSAKLNANKQANEMTKKAKGSASKQADHMAKMAKGKASKQADEMTKKAKGNASKQADHMAKNAKGKASKQANLMARDAKGKASKQANLMARDAKEQASRQADEMAQEAKEQASRQAEEMAQEAKEQASRQAEEMAQEAKEQAYKQAEEMAQEAKEQASRQAEEMAREVKEQASRQAEEMAREVQDGSIRTH